MRLSKGEVAVELDDRLPVVVSYHRGGRSMRGHGGDVDVASLGAAEVNGDAAVGGAGYDCTVSRVGENVVEYRCVYRAKPLVLTWRFELFADCLKIRLTEVDDAEFPLETLLFDSALVTAGKSDHFLRHVGRRANWGRGWCPGTATYDRWEDFGRVGDGQTEPGLQAAYHAAVWNEGMCLGFWSSVMVEPWWTRLGCGGDRDRASGFTVRPGIYRHGIAPPLEIRVGILGDYDGDGTVDWTDAANWEGDQTFAISQYTEMYREALVYKLFLDAPGMVKPHFTFDQVLERVRMVHEVSREANGGEPLKQIVYLVGWQRGGHDCLYPDHSLVNERCGTVEDLRRLVREARGLNCVVSLHGNLDDALEGEPLFEEAPLSRREDGSAAVWFKNSLHGKDTFSINHTLAVRRGFHRKRLEQMRALIPELIPEVGGTIHFDAHRPYNETFEAGVLIGAESEVGAMRETQAMFRAAGLDITTEDTDSEKRGIYAWTWIGPHWLCPYVTVMHHGRQGSLWRAGVPSGRGGQVNCGEARALGLGFFHTEGPGDTAEQVRYHLVADWMYAQVLQRRRMTHYQTFDWNTGVAASYEGGRTRGGRDPAAVETWLDGGEVARGMDRLVPWREDWLVFISLKGGPQEWRLPASWAGHGVASEVPVRVVEGRLSFTAPANRVVHFRRVG